VLRKVDSLDGIAAVCAHPQALAQCHAWLSHHLPNAERRRSRATAEGARLAGLDPTLAALASERAASEYGLFVVAPAVQDDAHNRTRFAIVAHPGQHPQPKASGHDCTSLVVSVANRPGAVHDMLQPLKAHGVSMTRFESRPARSGQWEYYFYVDLDGHPDQPNVALALQELHEACAVLQAARHVSRRLALGTRFDVRTTRRDRLRPDGRLVRARAEARRHGSPRHRLQQVALDDRAGEAPRRHRHRLPSRRCSPSRARTSSCSPSPSRRPRRPSRRSAT
jgi:hypothetical protein